MAKARPLHFDFLAYQTQLRWRTQQKQKQLYAPLRKRYLVAQPEEVVRQLLLLFLIEARGFPKLRLREEKQIDVHGLRRRCDIVAYDAAVRPLFIVECKAPYVPLNQAVFEQIAQYNMALRVPYLMVSNGQSSYVCRIDFERADFDFLEELPTYQMMCTEQ